MEFADMEVKSKDPSTDTPLPEGTANSSLTNGNSKEEIDSEEAGRHSSPRNIHGFRWVLVVLSILSSILLYALDNTIVANIIPPILKDLGHAEQLSWVSVGFMIGGLTAAMPIGKLYGIFNAYWLYMGSIVLFMAGSALCGAAPNMASLIIGRVIAGVGGNGMYVGVVTLVSVNTTDKERPTYLGLIGLVYGAGTVLGPITGGAIAVSSATWRWGFYINLVFGAVFIPILFTSLPSFDPRPHMKLGPRFGLFDYVGAVLQAGFLTSGIMAINFGGTLYSWGSGQTIGMFVASGVLLIAFGIQQTFCILTSEDGRMFPVHFLKMKEPVLLFILMAANNAGAFILMYYIPLYFQFTTGSGALHSGVQMSPLIIAVTVAIMLNGAMMSKFGYYFPWYVCGSALILIGGGLLSRINMHTKSAEVYGYQILLGFGVGAFLQAGYAVIQGILDVQHMAYGVTFMLVAQLLGISLSLSISGATYVNITVNNLKGLLPHASRVQLQSAISGTSDKFFESLSDTVRAAALEIIVASMAKIFILVAVAGGVTLLASLLLSRQKLNLGPAGGA